MRTRQPESSTMIGQFTFIGEVVLLVWLIGWCGRTRGVRSTANRRS